MNRALKRSVIIFIFLLLCSMLVFLLVTHLRPTAHCSDGVQNQNETGVDCGGVCTACQEQPIISPLTTIEQHLIASGQNSYDAVAVIKNPNTTFGSDAVAYVVQLVGQNGQVVYSRRGTTTMLPSEEKYIAELNLQAPTSERVALEIVISEPAWQKFVAFEKPELVIINRRYGSSLQETEFAEAFGLLWNKSSFDFKTIKVVTVLKDFSGGVVAVGKTELDGVSAFERRDFRIVWPQAQAFSGAVDTVNGIVMQADANVFSSENFLKQYPPQSVPEISE